MKILSLAFENGAAIPGKYSCKGENVNPELEFQEVPTDAKSLALIMHDPDAPREGGFTHWVVYNMPPETTNIPEASSPPGMQAQNGAGENKYIGPCPPSGTHRYFFKLYALDKIFDASVVADKNDLTAVMEGHILEEAELMGKFSK